MLKGVAQAFGLQHDPIIIAECGASHDGDVKKAKELVRAAHHVGASVAKFQLGVEQLCSPSNPLASEFSRLALSYDEWDDVRAEADSIGIAWTASAWSDHAFQYLGDVSVPFVKIGSGDLTHDPTIKAANKIGLPVVLSTGMATEMEISRALGGLLDAPAIALLACTVNYPCSVEQAHLARVGRLSGMLGGSVVAVGYSSHCGDWRVPALSARIGADIIEAHLALEPRDDGSLSVESFGRMVRYVRGQAARSWDMNFSCMATGSPNLGPLPCEAEWMKVARRDPFTGLRQ